MFNKFQVTFFDTKSVVILLDILCVRRQNKDIKMNRIKNFVLLYRKIRYTAYNNTLSGVTRLFHAKYIRYRIPEVGVPYQEKCVDLCGV